MRKAVVRNTDGFVVNIIEWVPSSTWPIPEGCSLIAAGKASPGDTWWDGKKFVKLESSPPEPPRDPLVEIDEIKANYDALEARVEEIEKP